MKTYNKENGMQTVDMVVANHNNIFPNKLWQCMDNTEKEFVESHEAIWYCHRELFHDNRRKKPININH